MSVVVITEVGDLDPRPGIILLEDAGFEVVVLWDGLDAPLPPGADRATAAIVGFAAFGQVQLDLFPSLRLVCTTSTGVDMVDIAAADARGVEVVGLGGVSSQEVALHAFALILAALRELPAGRRVVSGGGWTADLDVVPRAANDLVLGLIGYGRIGRELARLARPLFARIVAADPAVMESSDGVELTGMDDVLRESDVVSLHLPATPSTRGIIDADALARMRAGALLVNVSRGELVDSTAARAALDRGDLSGYVADVLDAEPPAGDHPLRTHPRAIVTPHMGFLSTASLERYELDPARTVIERLAHAPSDRADSVRSPSS
ncbi:NAD(P)-dependent oxidoreductase [Microbacterium sp. NPDC079995]|uniref:NAD(P)-dependent oxidoreductase n=1 Tax=unclassified Microbacterium TaxID=2609290 RepID=UPI00345058D9